MEDPVVEDPVVPPVTPKPSPRKRGRRKNFTKPVPQAQLVGRVLLVFSLRVDTSSIAFR